ncbi:MAG: Ribosomal silencing factor RsfS [Holosporales bacterium]
MHIKELSEKIINILEEKKATDIKSIDLRQKGAFVDFMIIATGTSTRQVYALAQYVEEVFKQEGVHPHMEGKTQCEWVLLFGSDLVVHILLPETRQFYELEKMWGTVFDANETENHKTLL